MCGKMNTGCDLNFLSALLIILQQVLMGSYLEICCKGSRQQRVDCLRREPDFCGGSFCNFRQIGDSLVV